MFESISWDVWLGVGSGALLVVGLVLAAARRNADDAYQSPARRHGPMPLYQEGNLS
jgi:hypothetical protein